MALKRALKNITGDFLVSVYFAFFAFFPFFPFLPFFPFFPPTLFFFGDLLFLDRLLFLFLADLERRRFFPFFDDERDLARLAAFFGDLERARLVDFLLGDLLLLFGDLLLDLDLDLDLDFDLDFRVGLGILVTLSNKNDDELS